MIHSLMKVLRYDQPQTGPHIYLITMQKRLTNIVLVQHHNTKGAFCLCLSPIHTACLHKYDVRIKRGRETVVAI